FHQVEGVADHRLVFAEQIHAWHRHVGRREGSEPAVFAVDRVGRGQELPRGLLPQHVASSPGRQKEGGVRLTSGELLDDERPGETFDVGREVTRERSLVEAVALPDGHDVGEWHGAQGLHRGGRRASAASTTRRDHDAPGPRSAHGDAGRCASTASMAGRKDALATGLVLALVPPLAALSSATAAFGTPARPSYELLYEARIGRDCIAEVKVAVSEN